MASTRHNQFYLTLPSNSSMDYYPNNTVANYVTHLPSSIHLTGDGDEWEIALVEAHYPCSFLSVCNDASIYVYYTPKPDDEGGDDTLVGTRYGSVTSMAASKVECGNYKDIDELLSSINADVKMKLYGLEFEHDADTKKVELISMNENVIQIELSPTLALQMGYDIGDLDLKNHRKAKRPPNLLAGIPSHMYVYC